MPVLPAILALLLTFSGCVGVTTHTWECYSDSHWLPRLGVTLVTFALSGSLFLLLVALLELRLW